MMNKSDLKTLEIKLGDQTVGYITHYQDGKNIFIFDNEYIEQGPNRPTLGLAFNDLSSEANTLKKLNKAYVTMHALPTYFSNLLPEGGLKDYILAQTNIHPNDEFALLAELGGDLPGNIKARAIEPLSEEELKHDHQPDVVPLSDHDDSIQFSLSGIQIKFSMRRKDGRYTLSHPGRWGDYIIKTPSTIHKFLPENEYSMMRLADAIGVNVPEIKLIKLSDIIDLPEINLPQEQHAYAIKRFDRTDDERIHIEDFAQVINVRARHKYNKTNYDTMARIIDGVSQQKLKDIKEFIRRLTVNILLGNTDAHLKNWSLIYDDQQLPKLSPAYDIVSSLGYISNREIALNFGGEKNFYAINQKTVDNFSRRTQISAQLINETIEETVTLAQEKWKTLIKELPVSKMQLTEIKKHLKKLQNPFQISL